MCMKYEDEISFSFPISLLLAPPAGVDAAPLGPHEVLGDGEQSRVVQAATERVRIDRGRVHRGRVHQLGHGGGGVGIAISAQNPIGKPNPIYVKPGRWLRRRHGSWVGSSLETGDQQQNNTELGSDHGDTEENI